ncbi:MAG: hypothetical protein ACKPH7_28575 [Planktothrix sp.]
MWQSLLSCEGSFSSMRSHFPETQKAITLLWERSAIALHQKIDNDDCHL